MSTVRVPGPLTRLARRHRFTRSPLRRSTDRVEPAVTAGAAVVALLANAAANGVALLGGGWVLLGSLWWTACRVLDRINTAWWELEWTHTGPGWSRRTWQ